MFDKPHSQRPLWLILGLAFPIIFLNGWFLLLFCSYMEPIVNIVVAASLIAFLLNYPVIFLEGRGVSRGWAIGVVLLSALVLLSLLSLVLGPLVFQQLVDFANRFPAWIEAGQKQLQALKDQTILQQLPIDLSGFAAQLTSQISRTIETLTSRIINVTLGTINSAFNALLTLLLTIFLVLYGERLWQGLLSWLPESWGQQIQSSLKQSFQNYFAGQAIMASILAVVMTLAFLVLKVPFGLLFGLVIGIASLIPFGGFLSITVVSSLIAFQSAWLGLKVLIAAVILSQINENIVAPRVIGNITGLNPAVVFIALLVGFKLGGVLGLLLAVPTASFVKRMTDLLKAMLSSDVEAIAPPSATP